MVDVGFVGFLLLVFSLLTLAAIVLVPLIEKLFQGYGTRVTNAAEEGRARRIARVGSRLNAQNRLPDRYRDVQLDELIAEGRYDEAQGLLTERKRLAIEQGRDERIDLYREYQQRIDRRQP